MVYKRLLLLFLLVLYINLTLTGCWNSREINTLAITICMGIDKTDRGYMVTQQIINPTVIAAKRATNEPPVVLYVEEGEDIFAISRKMTTQCPRKIYYSHLRMVIFGEELAKDGIAKMLDFFSRDHEFRTDFFFAVAKGTTANKILSNLTVVESIPGIEMYNSLETTEDAWALTKSVKIIELANSISEDGNNPVLSGIETTDKRNSANWTEALRQSYVSSKLMFTGLGAFRKDKLVGWLDENESKGFNYILGNIISTVEFIEYGESGKITFEIKAVKSKIRSCSIEGIPAINVNIHIDSNIAAAYGDLDLSKQENVEMFCKKLESKTALFCNMAVKKAQQDFKSDIFGFGEEIHRSCPKVWAKIKDNWNEEFENLPVSVSVNVKVGQLGQVTDSFYTKGND